MSIPLLCTVILALLLFALGFHVSLGRGRERRGAGFDDDPTSNLYKRVRAHGNTAEYAPMFAILFLALDQFQLGTWEVSLIIAATACRVLIVAGMLMSPDLNKAQPLRFVGALGTYVTGLGLAVALLLHL